MTRKADCLLFNVIEFISSGLVDFPGIRGHEEVW